MIYLLPFGKSDILPCILCMRILVPLHLYQALDARTDCMERPRPQILKPTNKNISGHMCKHIHIFMLINCKKIKPP